MACSSKTELLERERRGRVCFDVEDHNLCERIPGKSNMATQAWPNRATSTSRKKHASCKISPHHVQRELNLLRGQWGTECSR